MDHNTQEKTITPEQIFHAYGALFPTEFEFLVLYHLYINYPSLDIGKPVHMQKLHVHIIGRHACALNIDGSWKHEHKSYVMTSDVKEILSEWGFLLPDEFY